MKLEDFFVETPEGSFVCDFCGALVTDTVRHLRWHRFHGDLPPVEPVLPRSEPQQPECATCAFSHPLVTVVDHHVEHWGHQKAATSQETPS